MKLQPKVLLFLMIIAVLLWLTSEYWEGWFLGVVSFVFAVSVFLAGVVITLENRHPAKTIAWLIVLAVLPIVGFIFYIFFGRPHHRKRRFEKKAQTDLDEFAHIDNYVPFRAQEHLEKVPPHQYRLLQLAQRIGKSPISFYSKTKVLRNGDETFAEMLKAIEQAKHHIHLEFYIVRDDYIGREIQQLLIEKVKKGVEVRFIMDSVGCLQLPQSYIHKLREAGAQVYRFNPVTFPLLNSNVNFRNHRKILVVDGQIGFTGGLNIGDEYLGKTKQYGQWRDTHIKLEKEVVRSLQTIFLQDWYYLTGEKLLDPPYLSLVLDDDHYDQGGLQVIAGGPDQKWEVLKKMFFSMITSAIRKINIASPYLIPDEDILSALKTASLSGVEVNILVPGVPDKKMVFWATKSYFQELLEADVNIYMYQKGFMHSKVIIVDDELASIGSANMDMRSFHLNFEVNAFLYRDESIQKLSADFEQDMQDSYYLDIEEHANRKYRQRLAESLARLFSPLL